jgi:ABC-type nitrate/sulfonate/bicarbonate transport system ATPase subunit
MPDDGESGNVIEVTNLCLGYDGISIIENLSFRVPTGGCVGLLGRSGSGKTTVLHAVVGILPIISGQITLGGRNGTAGEIRGLVFQEIALLGWRTVLENVCFPGRQKDVTASSSKAVELLTNLGLRESMHKYPHELSTGMRRRVEFARALLLDNDFLVADEPFSALDIWTRQTIWKWFRDFRQHFERTTLLTTHSPEEAMFLCQEIIVLSHKQPSRASRRISIPYQWTVEQVLGQTDENVRRIYREIVDSVRDVSET